MFNLCAIIFHFDKPKEEAHSEKFNSISLFIGK